MQKLTTRLIVSASILILSTSSASALVLDATIEGIYTSSALTTLIPGLVIDGNGDATATLEAGQVILVDLLLDNTAMESLLTIGATITFQGDQMSYLGAFTIPPAIFKESGFGATPSLGNIGSGGIKGNSPFPDDGTGGDVWLQAAAYGSPGGVTGISDLADQTALIQLAFTVTGASGSEVIDFVLSFTTGDEVLDQSGNQVATMFDGTTINVPEPGSLALALASLGTVGLVTRVRRRNN